MKNNTPVDPLSYCLIRNSPLDANIIHCKPVEEYDLCQPAKPGRWGPYILLIDPPDACATLDYVEMNRNKVAQCCVSVRFQSHGSELLFMVGTVTDMMIHPL